MPKRFPAVLAGILAGLLILQPAVAWAGDVPKGEPPASAPVDVSEEIVFDVNQARVAVAVRLVECGRAPEDAAAMAGALTEDDLRVLAENPDMLQSAGDSNAYAWGIIGAVVLIGGIIVLLIASDGSVSVF